MLVLGTRKYWLGVGLICACGGRAGEPADEQGDLLSGQGPATSSTQPAASAPPQPGAAAASAPAGFINPSSPQAPAGPYVAPSAPPSLPSSAPPSPPPASSPPASSPQPPEPPRPDPAPPPVANACFDYLGDWITCEHAGWPHVEKTEAADLLGCMQLCQQRADCTAVTEYFWMDRPDLGCWLYTSTCEAPAGGVWQEEDGGRQYRKHCADP